MVRRLRRKSTQQPPRVTLSQVLHTLDQLVEQNHRLEQQNRELMDQIDSLRQVLAKEPGKAPETVQEKGADKDRVDQHRYPARR